MRYQTLWGGREDGLTWHGAWQFDDLDEAISEACARVADGETDEDGCAVWDTAMPFASFTMRMAAFVHIDGRVQRFHYVDGRMVTEEEALLLEGQLSLFSDEARALLSAQAALMHTRR